MHPRSGAFALDPKLPDGRTTVKLIASDRAGNRSIVTRTVAVDRTSPRVHIDRVPAVLGTRAPDAARIDRRRLAGGAAGAARRRLGRAARSRWQRAARLRGEHRAASRCRCSTSRRASTRSRSRRPTAPATRPRQTPARSPSTRPRSCARSSVLSLGARGADVVQLERRLKAFGTYHGPFTRFYNARTAAAVRTLPARARPARHGHRDARRCCSSAPSASSCT